MDVWVSGRVAYSEMWEVLGIYDSEQKAVSRCTKKNDFVAPAKLNEDMPEETEEWPGCYYPLWKKGEG